MTFIEKIRIIERIDQLIKFKATGSSQELANRLNLSRSTVYELINCMKSMGAEVEYCRNRKSLIYQSSKTFSIGFVDLKKIKGGKIEILNFTSLSEIFGQTQFTFTSEFEFKG
jgi:biotin operon repressor